MTKRSKWCEYDKETRKVIKKRDNNRCIICGSTGALQIMHIFMNRAHGGRGCKENGVLGCIKCHRIMDNPIGDKECEESKKYLEYCKNYLIRKENLKERFKNKEEFKNYLEYSKEKCITEDNVNLANINIRDLKKCRNCISLIKIKNEYSLIPWYYCKFLRKRRSKNDLACEKIKEIRK